MSSDEMPEEVKEEVDHVKVVKYDRDKDDKEDDNDDTYSDHDDDDGTEMSERYSEEDEIQPQGRMGSYTTTLTLEQWIEEIQMWNLQTYRSTELGQPNTLQSLD